jgi:hypothetical protein
LRFVRKVKKASVFHVGAFWSVVDESGGSHGGAPILGIFGGVVG